LSSSVIAASFFSLWRMRGRVIGQGDLQTSIDQ
jgi:hypothetical protein